MFSDLQATVDAWYLDGFSPNKNPAMWEPKLLQQIARLSRPGATFATFSVAGSLRRGLQNAGFSVEKVAGFGRKREMLRGHLSAPPPVPSATQPWFHYAPHDLTERHAIIIGAGLAGITTAHALARRGWQITLIERHAAIAQEASGNLSGVLLPRLTTDMSGAGQFYLSAFLHSTQWLNQLKQGDKNLPWFATGVLSLQEAKTQKRLAALNLPAELIQFLDQTTASTLSGIPLQGPGTLFPQGGWLSPPQLCQWLLDDSTAQIELKRHTTAIDLQSEERGWQVIGDSGVIATAPVVIFANGEDAKRFSGDGTLPLQRVRGQLSYTKASHKSRRLKMPLCYDGYIIPEFEGRHCVGASYDLQDDDTQLKETTQQQIHTALQKQLSDIGPLESVAGRVAFRTATTDHLPLIGALFDEAFYREQYADLRHGRPATHYPLGRYRNGLFMTVGHGSRGLVSCPFAAEIIAAQLEDEPQPLPTTLLGITHPARFLIRQLKRGR